MVSAGPWVRHRWDLYIHEYKLQNMAHTERQNLPETWSKLMKLEVQPNVGTACTTNTVVIWYPEQLCKRWVGQ